MLRFFQNRIFISFILMNFLILFFVQILFYFLQEIQSDSATTSIKTVLRQEITSSNLFLIARSLQDLNEANLIRCVTLKKENSNSLYLDLTFKGNCETSDFSLNGKSVVSKFESLNGERWLIEFISVNGSFFILSLWLVRILLCFVASTIYLWYLNKIKNERFVLTLEQQQKKMLENLAAQVIHDVASPLSALNVVIHDSALPSQIRELLKIAHTRTESIIRDLKYQTNFLALNPIEKTDVGNVLTLLVKEKQIIHKNIFLGKTEFLSSARANPKELARIFSNIINNAIEAGANSLDNKITITAEESDLIKVVIHDEGCGIPTELLSKLGQKGVSFNKTTGSGLGLFHATHALESWGGKLEIESQPKYGTTVSILLQKFTTQTQKGD